MHLIVLALIAAAALAIACAVQFLRREQKRDEDLVAMFEPGATVALGQSHYLVEEIYLGFALLGSVDNGPSTVLNLLTPAGTYRLALLDCWARVNPPMQH